MSVWTTKKGKKIKVTKLEDDHLLRIVNWVSKNTKDLVGNLDTVPMIFYDLCKEVRKREMESFVDVEVYDFPIDEKPVTDTEWDDLLSSYDVMSPWDLFDNCIHDWSDLEGDRQW